MAADRIEDEDITFTEEVAKSDCSDEELRAISITPDFSPANLASLQELLWYGQPEFGYSQPIVVEADD